MLGDEPLQPGEAAYLALGIVSLDRLKDDGKKVAMVETGGDPGRATTYEEAGFVLLPIARYFKNL